MVEYISEKVTTAKEKASSGLLRDVRSIMAQYVPCSSRFDVRSRVQAAKNTTFKIYSLVSKNFRYRQDPPHFWSLLFPIDLTCCPQDVESSQVHQDAGCRKLYLGVQQQ